MYRAERILYELDEIECQAAAGSPIHRLDPRAKIITTALFIGTVLSFPKYSISALIPFLVYPVAVCALSGIRAGYLIRKLLWASPFVVLVGVWNPLIDRDIALYLFSVPVTGGWISFLSLCIKLGLTVSAAVLLISTTGFYQVCSGLHRMKVPAVFVTQFMLIYRYLFLLSEESLRLVRAHSMRKPSGGISLAEFPSLAGQLFLRSIDRAHRVHTAMTCRGYTGELVSTQRLGFVRRGIAYTALWACLFIFLRAAEVTHWLGDSIVGGAP